MGTKGVGAQARLFWSIAGGDQKFPRDLESAVARALPIAVVKLPNLSTNSLNLWMVEQGLATRTVEGSRRLRACLVAKRGKGMVFLDGTDSSDQLRFSLAHEVSHFMLDYLLPRQKAIKAFGPGVLEVLDRLREPTPAERFAGIIKGVQLGIYRHLTDRSSHGVVERTDVLEAEDRADLLALELLAPRQKTLQIIENQMKKGENEAGAAAVLLVAKQFGIPLDVARQYVRALAATNKRRETFGDWLNK